MKKIIYAAVSSLLFVFLISIVSLQSVSAATFNRNRIIDDGVFDNVNSMSATQIDSFLNGFSGSCISSNSGFRAIDPTGYNPSQGYLYGGYVTAGQVIYSSAQAYNINPQALLTTLEKEQSLVTGRNNFAGYCNNGDQHKYASAVGYGCPDSGTTHSYTGLNLYQRNGVTVGSTGTTCVNTSIKAGFSQQVIRAAWLLKFGEQRSKGNVGWAVIKGSWDNSDDPQTCYGGPMTQGTFARCPSGGATYYDGYTTIDGAAVHMDSGATAALYWYTPHFSGNQNFFNLFTAWFGSTLTPSYNWQLTQQYAYTDNSKTTQVDLTTLTPGQRVYIGFAAVNTGNTTWTNTGNNPIRVGTSNARDRNSSFCDPSWYGCNRPSSLTAPASVAPGETGTFEFWYKAPSYSGTYNEHFSLLAEGAAWMNDPGMNFYTKVMPVPGSTTNILTSNASLGFNQLLTSNDGRFRLVMQGDGNLVVYAPNRALWSSRTDRTPSQYTVMQSDGNLVIYDTGGRATWNTRTAGKGVSRLVMQDDGNLVIYDGSGRATWNTRTAGQL